MASLSNTQLEILKLFHEDQSQEELYEIKQLLSEYLADKLMKEVKKESLEKGFTTETIDSWKNDHFRTSYNKK